MIPMIFAIADSSNSKHYKIIHKIAPLFTTLCLFISSFVLTYIIKYNQFPSQSIAHLLQIYATKGFWHSAEIVLFFGFALSLIMISLHGLWTEATCVYKPYKKSLPTTIVHSSMYLSILVMLGYLAL